MDMANCIQSAINYIEDNITDDLNTETIASQAFMSVFHFQRLFSVVCNMSLGEYIRNRRLSLAGTDVKASDAKIIDIGIKYGYESPESFSRAFSRFHGVSPMMARSQKGYTNSFAKISVQSILGGNSIMQKLSYFYLMFHVSDPIEAYEFYHDVFGATKISEEYLPNGDPYIMVNISGCNILIRPGEITAQGVGIGCCAKFDTADELRAAYEILAKEGQDYSLHTDWHWTSLAAQVTDKYGVGWLLSTC